MRLSEIGQLRRGDTTEIRVALSWIEPAFRPPPRSVDEAWDFLFRSFENSTEYADHGELTVAHDVCNYLRSRHGASQQESVKRSDQKETDERDESTG